MKHLLNNLSQEEKNRILEQHSGGKIIDTSKFKRLLESKLGDSKPLVMEQQPAGSTELPATPEAGGGGQESGDRFSTNRPSNSKNAGGFGPTTNSSEAPAQAKENKAQLPTKLSETEITFVKGLYDAGRLKTNIQYTYDCAKRGSYSNITAITGGDGKWVKVNSQTLPDWVKKNPSSNVKLGKMLNTFCSYALPDGPFYDDNGKLKYVCKNGQGSGDKPC
jgi:hypothetical protein